MLVCFNNIVNDFFEKTLLKSEYLAKKVSFLLNNKAI